MNDFFTKWQNRDFIVKMPFVSTNYGCNVHDIQQGNVGDCWFLSSVMTGQNLTLKNCNPDPDRLFYVNILVVNFRNGLIEKVICLKENQSQENGKYRFKFYHFDQWKEVIVDGHLPMCGTGLVANNLNKLNGPLQTIYPIPANLAALSFLRWIPL